MAATAGMDAAAAVTTIDTESLYTVQPHSHRSAKGEPLTL